MGSAAGEVWATFAPLTDEFEKHVLHLEKRLTEVGRAGSKSGLFSPTISDSLTLQDSNKTVGISLGRRSVSLRELRDISWAVCSFPKVIQGGE